MAAVEDKNSLKRTASQIEQDDQAGDAGDDTGAPGAPGNMAGMFEDLIIKIVARIFIRVFLTIDGFVNIVGTFFVITC